MKLNNLCILMDCLSQSDIIAIVSASIALFSVLIIIAYEIRRQIDKFEDFLFECLNGMSILTNDVFQIISLEKLSGVEKIIEGDAMLTQGFLRLVYYSKTHKNGFLEFYSKISVDEKTEDKTKCYSMYMTKLSQNYVQFRKDVLKDKNFKYDNFKTEFENYSVMFRKFTFLGVKYSSTLLMFPNLFFFLKPRFYKALEQLVAECNQMGISIYGNN